MLRSFWRKLFRSIEGRGRRPRRYLPVLELLEDRTLMSITLGSTQWNFQGPAPITQSVMVQPQSTPNSIDTGAVEAIAVDPTNANHLYAGTVNGGIWQTPNYTNLAANPWTTSMVNASNQPLPSLAIMSLAVSPVNSSVIYAGTGNLSATAGDILYPGAGGTAVGIYKSTNGGLNWSVIGGNTFGGLRVEKIIATSLNGGNTLFAATADISVNSTSGNVTKGGIYESTNGGTSWTRLSGTNGLPSAGASDLEIDPGNPDILYAAIPEGLYARQVINDKIPAPTILPGIFELNLSSGLVVTNLTSTVTPLSQQLQNADVVLVSASKAGQQPIWVEAINNERVTGVFRGVSSNGNVAWTEVGTPPAIYDNYKGSSTLHFALTADPNNDQLVYLGGNSTNTSPFVDIIVRGNASNNTWNAITDATTGQLYAPKGTAAPTTNANITTAPHPDSRTLLFDGPNLLLGCDGGIYLCTNPSGASGTPAWFPLNGNINDSEVYSAAIDPYNGNLLGGAQDNGPFVIAGGTATNEFSGDGPLVAVDPVDHIQYYTSENFTWGALPDTSGNTAGGTYRSAGTLYYPNATVIDPSTGKPLTAGKNVYTLNPTNGNLAFEKFPFTTIFQPNAINPQHILVGGAGTLYLSTNEGNTFYSIGGFKKGSSDIKPVPVLGSGADVTAIAFGASNNANAAYVGLTTGSIYYSSDLTQSGGGFSPTDFSGVTPTGLFGGADRKPAYIVMEPNNSNIAFAVVYGIGAYQTTNGNTWTQISGNLSSLMTSTPANQLADQQESVTLYTPAGSSTPTKLLVGGLGGVFAMPLNANGTAGNGPYTWTTYGTGLPNVLVDSLQYNPQTGALVAGTLGQGIWTQSNALQITGSASGKAITLEADSKKPGNILVTDGQGNSKSVPSSSVQAINVVTNGADVIVGSQAVGTAGTTSFLTVPLTIAGSGGNLTVQDAGDSKATTLNVSNGQIGSASGDNLFGSVGSLTYSGMSRADLDLGSGANVLDLNPAPLGPPQPVYSKTGQYTVAGTQNVYVSSLTHVHVDNAAAVDAVYGPDTADRGSALSGLTPGSPQYFVQVLYLNVLGRAGAPAEIAGWVSVYNSQGQAAVADGIEGSPEARQRLVNTWYETYLHRAADSGGLGYWSNLLATETEEQVLSQILGSKEFYKDAHSMFSSGTDDERYVKALYQLLLDRTPAASEVAGWVFALPQLGDAGVAQGFLTSTEFRTNQFQAYYQTLLHRPADTGGLLYWVNSGENLLQVREGFEATAEFYQNG